MPSWLKTLLTDEDDQYDVGFVIWVVGTVYFFALQGLHWREFDPEKFGTAFAWMLAAGGGMSWLRSR